jgi:EF hand domain-containing protein
MSPTIWTVILTGALAMNAGAAVPWNGRDGEPSRRPRILERLDANGDGRLDQREREAAREAKRDRQGLQRRGEPGARGMHAHRGALLKRLDLNGDGHLDRQERRAARQAMRQHMLGRFDLNGDGRLDRHERHAAREAMRRHRPIRL